MRKSAAVVLGLVTAAAAACSGPAPKPTPYANTAWGFGATFQAPPKVSETAASATTAHSILVEANAGGDDFMVNVIDATTATADPDTILNNDPQVRAQAMDVDVGSVTNTTVGDINGHEARFDKDGKPVMLMRVFYINGRLYEVSANSEKGPTDPAVKAFLDSFHLVASGDAPPDADASANAANAPATTAPATNGH
jgi:hypothetical protein